MRDRVGRAKDSREEGAVAVAVGGRGGRAEGQAVRRSERQAQKVSLFWGIYWSV